MDVNLVSCTKWNTQLWKKVDDNLKSKKNALTSLILVQETLKTEWITERNNFTGEKTYYNLNCEIFLMSLILPQSLFV